MVCVNEPWKSEITYWKNYLWEIPEKYIVMVYVNEPWKSEITNWKDYLWEIPEK